MIWKTKHRTLDLSKRGMIMGILNVTPDSFSDGGNHYHNQAAALRHALQMVRDGAEIIDIGGESSRPGAAEVSFEQEIKRTQPIVRALRKKSKVLISIDTSKASVAQAAIESGADIVNDVSGLTRDKEMPTLCAKSGVGVIVMHMQGTPRTMQDNPTYPEGVVESVGAFFNERKKNLTGLGINPQCLCFDPGIGFGKSHADNLKLLREMHTLQKEHPFMLGVSRKSFIGRITKENDPKKRDPATAIITALAYHTGIRLHRVHNVAASAQALRIAEAMD